MVNENKTEELFRKLRQRIALMHDGEAFPTVRQVMAEYGFSQVTVTTAIKELKERGLLKSHVGRGSFVCKDEKAKPKMLLLRNDWPSEVCDIMTESLMHKAIEAGFNCEIVKYDYHKDITGSLSDYDADILILDSISDDHLSPEQVMALSQSPVPVILARNAVPISNINYVANDNMASGTLAANYLYRLGHHKLGLLFNEPHLLTTDTASRGFLLTAKSNKCSVDILDCKIQKGENSEKQVKAFCDNIAKGKYDLTAIFAISCHGAELLVSGLRKRGIRIPEDISVSCIGATCSTKGITAVDATQDEYDKEVIEMAKGLLDRKSNVKSKVDLIPVLYEGKTVCRLSQEYYC